MKTKLFSIVPKLPSIMVLIHSFLVVVAFGMWLLPSRNAASFGFILTIIIMLFDFPVERLFWKIFWPNLGGNYLWPKLNDNHLLGIITTFLWFLFLGGLYWFFIGMIVEIIHRKIRKIGEGSSKG